MAAGSAVNDVFDSDDSAGLWIAGWGEGCAASNYPPVVNKIYTYIHYYKASVASLAVIFHVSG